MMSIALSFYKKYISMPEFLILLGVPTFKSSQIHYIKNMFCFTYTCCIDINMTGKYKIFEVSV